MTKVLLPDRRSDGASARVRLARRQARPTKVLLLDNGKLRPEYGQYRVIFDVLKDALASRFPGISIVERSDNLLSGGAGALEVLADALAGEHYDAVLVALCDTGVSQPSAVLAALLEQRGTPTGLICEGIGTQVVRTTLERLACPLPYYSINAIRLATADEVADEFRPHLSSLIDDLTHDPEESAGESGSPDWPLEIDINNHDLSGAFALEAERLLISDGLPMLAPTPERVNSLLEATGLKPTDVVWPVIPPRSRPLLARDVAIVAAMAGCQPRWMWAVIAAYEAMVHEEFRLFQAAITTHPSGTLVLISGPRADESDIASGPGCLGPGFRANATIGRAVALAYRMFFDARPDGYDLTRQGSPAEFSYCCSENLRESPWPGLNSDLGSPGGTTVTVVKCEGPRNVLDNLSMTAESLMTSIADTMVGLGANNAYHPAGQTIIFLNPEHAHILGRAGWSKPDVQSFLFEQGRLSKSALKGRGSVPQWPKWFSGLERVPIAEKPEDILITVVGGAGPQSQVAIPWGLSRGVTVTVGQTV